MINYKTMQKSNKMSTLSINITKLVFVRIPASRLGGKRLLLISLFYKDLPFYRIVEQQNIQDLD